MNGYITSSIEHIIEKDNRTMLILCGISMYSFRDVINKYPDRVFNLGIMEQTAVGMAAGTAVKGMIPFLYTWSPFLVERAYEQLKLDFGSQRLTGNFIGLGASYDLTAFGESHYCPADVCILKQIKNMQIVVPGTDEEFRLLLSEAYDNNFPTYYRISMQKNAITQNVQFGKAKVVKKGAKATIIVVGPLLDSVMKVANDYDVTILYYTTVEPFDVQTFKKNLVGDRVLICEPYNSSAIVTDIINCVSGKSIRIELIGMEKNVVCKLGTYEDNLSDLGLSEVEIKEKLEKLLK